MVAVDSALGGSGRGGGGFFKVAYFKIPRQVDVEMFVCILKSCICVKKCIKAKYTSTFNNNCGEL